MLTGFWHGASWNFLLWGVYFAILLMVEKAFLLKWLQKIPAVFSHVYTMVLVMLSWALFAIEDFGTLGAYLAQLFGGGTFADAQFFYDIRSFAILLVILGSPIWLSLAVAAAAVMLSLYAVLWSLVASLWAVFSAVAVCAPAGIAAGILFACSGNFPALLSMIAAAMICGGMTIFLFFGCRAATKGAAWMTKGTIISIKRCFIRKENA
jgi:hypothetical protein